MTRRNQFGVLYMTLCCAPALGAGCLSELDKGPIDPINDASAADAALLGNDASVTADAASDAAPFDSGSLTRSDTFALTSDSRLIAFDRATGTIAGATRFVLPAGEMPLGADVRPADRSAVMLTSAGKLYSIDLQSGALTFKSSLRADPADTSEPFTTLAGARFGVDFNPVPDRLRIVSDSGQNLRVNVDTGLVITDTTLSPAAPGIRSAAYSNSFASACRTSLFTIDAVNRKLYLQDPPNDGRLVEIGALGDDVAGDVESFEIVTDESGVNHALAAVNGGAGARIATVDLTTGRLGHAQPIALDAGELLTSIFALPPADLPSQAPGELLATTESDKLISFMRGAPSKLCTSSAIIGLAASERILGADVRPANGMFYALSSQGNIYTIAIPSGVATLRSRLTPASASDPFRRLSGTAFAVGFNPVPDRLRVISDSGANLRVDVDDGKVTTDTAISQNSGTPALTALAYTNSFAGARSTTLFTIDSAADALGRVGGDPADAAACPNATNPNCGVNTALAPLALGDVDAVNGFDIEPSTGVALAALSVGCAAASTLYSLDLRATTPSPAAPMATALGMIGGSERLRSLSFTASPSLKAWVVTQQNELASFAPSNPADVTRVPLTGLAEHERLLGIDVRPLDGKLYAVGSSGSLYTLAENGKATMVAPLAGANGTAFALADTTFGFDFNPAADALRLVDSKEQNLRIVPSTRAAGAIGTTFVDSMLNPAGSWIKASAYTNNFAGTPRTTLLAIGGDAHGSTLYRQGGVAGDPSPNGGLLTPIGALGMGSERDIGFDVVGGNDGLALVTLERSGATRLFAINLGTGATTPFPATDNAIAGVSSVVGFALTLK